LNELLQGSHPARPDVLLGFIHQSREVDEMNEPLVALRRQHDGGWFACLGNDDRPTGTLYLFEESPRSLLKVLDRLDILSQTDRHGCTLLRSWQVSLREFPDHPQTALPVESMIPRLASPGLAGVLF
jgi:hypothetical protein